MKETFVSEQPMFDHQGNAWQVEGGVETWLPPENGKTALHTVKLGSRIEVVLDGHGPYLEDGTPNLEFGAVPRHTVVGEYQRIDEQMIDDGLYEKFAIIVDDQGKEHWVPFKGFRSFLDAAGKMTKYHHDTNYYATGVTVL